MVCGVENPARLAQGGPGHEEKLRFYVLEQPEPLMSLPWLQHHNPVLDWDTALVVKWGNKCKNHLLGTELGTTSIESPLAEMPPKIVEQSHDLAEVSLCISPGTVQ